MRITLGIAVALLSLVWSGPLCAQKNHSDNGNGTFTNPVIAADFPDPDVIRVDDTYYMVNTTMFVFPGVTILKSHDLVNWQYCANAVQRFDYSPCYNLEGCNRYGHGQWATSLKYHDGKFYLLFITLDEGGFLCTAPRAEGPWEIRKLPQGFYDPGLFFDDDGRIYVAHGYNKIQVTELDTNFAPRGRDSLVFTGDIRGGIEGTHVYKVNGYYYLYCTYGGLDGFQAALRSKNIYGPYEEQVVIRDTTHGINFGIHQGALIQTQTGEWWTMLFVDNGPLGRFPSLQPVTWKSGWPMVGVDGKAVTTFKKPNVGRSYPVEVLPTSDEFDSTGLGMQWEWNHNPDPVKWSLSENPGHLRLAAASVVDSFPRARNTLTQRMFAYYSDSLVSVSSTRMEFGSLQEGDAAGLAVFGDPYAYIGIRRTNGRNFVVMVNNGRTVDSAAVSGSTIYLRAGAFHGSGAAPLYRGKAVPGSGNASFSYSLDGRSFVKLGDDLHMRFNLRIFTGNKFCLFAYATKALGGYADFDWFRTSAAPAESRGQAQNIFTMSREERDAYFAKINAGSKKDWQRMIDLLHVHLPDSLPPPARDPRRPKDTFQKEGSSNWYDKEGNLYTRSAWGTWNNYDEAKANPFRRLPDPLKLNNGRPVTTPAVWWKLRRGEIAAAFDREIMGTIPPKVPGVHWSVVHTSDTAIGGMAVVTKDLLGRVDNSLDTAIHVEIQATLTVPRASTRPVPVIMEFGFIFPPGFRFPGMGAPRGPAWQEQVLKEGWGYVEYVPTSVQADNGAGLTEGIIGLVNKGQPRSPGDWGALRAWAWGASRVLDYLETEKSVDARRVAIEGLSRYGKAVLTAMAYDPRFAMVLVGSSGKGGAALYRRDFGEMLGNVCSPDEYHWFAGNFLNYPLSPDSLTVDSHELIALCAPRPVFVSCGSPTVEGRWVDSKGQFDAAVAAGPVYRFLGKKALSANAMPPIGTALVTGDLAFRQHDEGHTVGPNWPVFLEWARKYLAAPTTTSPRK